MILSTCNSDYAFPNSVYFFLLGDYSPFASPLLLNWPPLHILFISET